MKKKDGSKTSPSLFATLKSKDKTSGKKNKFPHLAVEQNHNEATRTEEIEQENFMDSTMKLAVTNSEEKETKKSGERKVQKIGCGKIRSVNGKKKLQVRKFHSVINKLMKCSTFMIATLMILIIVCHVEDINVL